jgi:hypothetical protein
MKKFLLTGISLLSIATLPAMAVNYADSSGDNGAGFLDILSVDVTSTATTLSLIVNVAGDPSLVGNNWGKFLIGFETVPGGGANFNASGGWGKDIQMGTGGMDFYIGSWLDGGTGAEIEQWTGSAWNVISATYNPNPFNLSLNVGTSSLTYSFDFAALGLSQGSTFNFDVFASTGGSDTVVDSSGNPAAQTWGNAPYDSAANTDSYTIVVPEPGVGAILGLSAIILGCAIRRKA